MLHNNFSKDFAKQFRSESELYTATEEFPFGNLLIRQYAGDNGELSAIGEKLIDTFFNTRFIAQLLHSLKNENLPIDRQLLNKIKWFKNECETCQQREPYTARFYKDHIAMLLSFSELMNALINDFQDQVYDPLEQYYTHLTESANIAAVESSSIAPIIDMTEFYMKNILAYYNYIVTAWQFEASNSRSDKGVQLTSYIADQLQELMAYTENLIDSIDNIRSLMLCWIAQIQITEEQELYN
ncbi:hypothetical protein A3860_23305 [Niastella vici]|uniref:Uncharacterized protein n=1 Tax=Niastella vici TaxID=1703345 RepID=A0A1V9G046_9BACT|nr:hypothetical protein [Niastella vici]OQP63866.1 hypothetical protein A3860_23305 [Niastella vici]